MDPYKLLAERHGYGNSERYLKILHTLMTPQEANLVAVLPGSWEELAEKSGMTQGEVKGMIKKLFIKGAAIPKNYETLEGARFSRDVMQLHDSSQADRRVLENVGEHYLDLWEDFAQKEWFPRLGAELAKRATYGQRVMTATKALPDDPGVTPYDDVREILKAASLMAVVPCSCRTRAKVKDNPVETCLQFGRSAQYHITRGSGRRVNYDEALEVIDTAEEAGQVHIWANVQTLNSGAMCNCKNTACGLWEPLIQLGYGPGSRGEKSRFQATIDDVLCSGCQDCVDRCQFDAIEMIRPPGQKKYKAVVEEEKCWGCGVCSIVCEPEAIKMKLVRPIEHIPSDRPGAPVAAHQ